MSNGNAGVQYLITAAKSASSGSSVHLQVLSALGEAGGDAAQAYLITLVKSSSTGSTVHKAAIAALGRASRA